MDILVLGAARYEPTQGGVVKLGNIPYSITKDEVFHFMSRAKGILQRPFECGIHIIMERPTAKTMDCFVEFRTEDDAAAFVRKHEYDNPNRKRLGNRQVYVDSVDQEELLREIWPRTKCIVWSDMVPHIVQNDDSYSTGFQGFFTTEEMVGMARAAENPQRSPFSQKCVQRTFECMITSLFKFPWHATGLYTLGDRNALFRTYCQQLAVLLKKVTQQQIVNLDPKLLNDFVHAGLLCAGFSPRQKAFILSSCALYGQNQWPLCYTAEVWPFDISGWDKGTDLNFIQQCVSRFDIGINILMEQNAIPSELEVFSNPNPPYNVQLRFVSSPVVQSVRFENNYFFEKAFSNYLLHVAQNHENAFNVYPSMPLPHLSSMHMQEVSQIPIQSPRFLTGTAMKNNNLLEEKDTELMAGPQYTNNILNEKYNEDVSRTGTTNMNPYTSPPPKAKHSGSLFTQMVNASPSSTTGASTIPIATPSCNHHKSSSSHSLKDSASMNITMSTKGSPSTPKASAATANTAMAYSPSELEGPRHHRIESTSSTTSSGTAPSDRHQRSSLNLSTSFSSTVKPAPNTAMSTPLTTGPTIWSPVSAGTTTNWKFPSGGALAGRRASGSGGSGTANAVEKGDDSPTFGKGRSDRSGSCGGANNMAGGSAAGERSAPPPAPTTTSTSSRESMMNFLKESSRRQSVATTVRSSLQESSIREEPDEEHYNDRDVHGDVDIGGNPRGLDLRLGLGSLGGQDAAATTTAAGPVGIGEGLGRIQTTGNLVGLGHRPGQSSAGASGSGGGHAVGGSPWGAAGGKKINYNGRALRSDTA
ncbi:MAG: hypothetical protein Q9160_000334 [Pyrenula sp. 1 TL-2023]